VKVAVLGVGLIGGSIGLAARARLDAEVSGFDPERGNLDRALELGALDIGSDSVGEAVAEAELVFCAAPVRALGPLVVEALAESPEGAAVTDVGSTKRELLDGLAAVPGAERFVGGHPLAGAETAGVENARADLFEGARWYLTPAGDASDAHYDRVQRAVAELGARPQAIDADAHDRMMATVSHLPHVLANVLVQEAAKALGESSDRLPEVGPSFRDSARIAGSNPAIWADIFATNRDAVAGEIDAVSRRLADAAELIRAGDPDAVGAWHAAALEDRRALLESDLAGGPLRELRVSVQDRPGAVAGIALALGRENVNIVDMALYPTADARTGAMSLWVAGDDEAKRAASVVDGLGHAVAIVGSDG
jgi:prephenate dehydrogenase